MNNEPFHSNSVIALECIKIMITSAWVRKILAYMAHSLTSFTHSPVLLIYYNIAQIKPEGEGGGGGG